MFEINSPNFLSLKISRYFLILLCFRVSSGYSFLWSFLLPIPHQIKLVTSNVCSYNSVSQFLFLELQPRKLSGLPYKTLWVSLLLNLGLHSSSL